MTATLMAPTDPMTEDEFDDFREALDAGFYGDPDDDEDDDGELDYTPYPTPIDDDRRRNDAVRCPCPALEPYPPAGWLSLTAWDELDFIAGLDESSVVDGGAVWVPEAKVPWAWAVVTESTTTFETVFTPGLWFDFTPMGA